MNHGYVTLAAIEKAKAFLDEKKPNGYEHERDGGHATLRTDVFTGPGANIPNFVIYWNVFDVTFEAHFTPQGEFVKLIEEGWAYTQDFNPYLQRSEVRI